MKTTYLFILLFPMLCLSSCSTADDPVASPEEEINYYEGIFVLNEGNFGAGNSSVSYVNENLEVTPRLFHQSNSGIPLGDTAQDMAFGNQFVFIVVNASNKVEVVDRKTFESVATFEEGLENPRQITLFDGKAFISNWGDGSNPDDDFIAVVDMTSHTLLEKIPVAEGPEELLSFGNKIIVAHTGGWNFNNKISVIDAMSHQVEKLVDVGDVPNSMVVRDGKLLVLASGRPSFAEQGPSRGKITWLSLSDHTIVEELIFPEGIHPSQLRLDGGAAYFTGGNDVYRMELSNPEIPAAPYIAGEQAGVLYAFQIRDGVIYTAFATADFTGNGTMIRYDSTGTKSGSVEVGVNPTRIYLIP